MTRLSSDIFTVSKLNRFVKHILDSEIGQIWLSAEISNFVAASSGHWYFTLKDSKAQIKAAMFKGANRRVLVKPKEGDHVLIRGNVGLYEARGDYQLIVEHLEQEGTGRLKQQFEALKQKLAYEGLFAPEVKTPIPERPRTIGVITSATGAAIQDTLSVLKRRNPTIKVIVYPAQVQGIEAPAHLIKAIQKANLRNEVDVLLLTRGGGSLEDLWCFNDETLARCIFNSELPIVSAVGHEIDFTIADFVADLRAATPSAAAEILSYSSDESLSRMTHLQDKMRALLLHSLSHKQRNLDLLQTRIQHQHPKNQIQQQWQQLDNLVFSLQNSFQLKLTKTRNQLELLNTKFKQYSPDKVLPIHQHHLADLERRLFNAMKNKLTTGKKELASTCQLLDTVSPLGTLARGYSISFKEDKVVRNKKELATGDTLKTRLLDGIVESKITKIF